MHFILSILSITLVFYSTQACKGRDCDPLCAAEIKDPTNQRTFRKKSALEKFNKNFKKEDESMSVHLK